MINCYRIRAKKLREENEHLSTVLKKYKDIIKGLLTILYEAGIMKETQSFLATFGDVTLFLFKPRKTTSKKYKTFTLLPRWMIRCRRRSILYQM